MKKRRPNGGNGFFGISSWRGGSRPFLALLRSNRCPLRGPCSGKVVPDSRHAGRESGIELLFKVLRIGRELAAMKLCQMKKDSASIRA